MRLSMHKVGRRWEARLAEICPRGALINYRSMVDYEIDGKTYHVFRTFSSSNPEKARAKAERWVERRNRKREKVISAEQQEISEYIASEEL